jgi:L-ribulose-5-phosphate 4-epimerase
VILESLREEIYQRPLVLRKHPHVVWTSSNVSGRDPLGGYAKVGGDEIGREGVENIGDSPAILLKNHGVFTLGKTPEGAIKAAVMVEDLARTVFYAMQMGHLEEIPSDEVARAHRRYVEEYSQSSTNP